MGFRTKITTPIVAATMLLSGCDKPEPDIRLTHELTERANKRADPKERADIYLKEYKELITRGVNGSSVEVELLTTTASMNNSVNQLTDGAQETQALVIEGLKDLLKQLDGVEPKIFNPYVIKESSDISESNKEPAVNRIKHERAKAIVASVLELIDPTLGQQR